MKVMDAFEEQRFGRYHVKTSVDMLDSEIQRAYETLLLTNKYKSAKSNLCPSDEMTVDSKMRSHGKSLLNKLKRWDEDLKQCGVKSRTV